MSFPTRRQKIAAAVLFLLLAIGRLPTLLQEGVAYSIGALLGNAILALLLVFVFGKIWGAVTPSEPTD